MRPLDLFKGEDGAAARFLVDEGGDLVPEDSAVATEGELVADGGLPLLS